MQRSTIDHITKYLFSGGVIALGASALASGTDYLLNGKSEAQLYYLSIGFIIGSTMAMAGFIINNEFYNKRNN